MKIVLPRPHRIAPRLPLHDALALDCLKSFIDADGIGTIAPTTLLVNHVGLTEDHARRLLASLQCRHLILFSNNHFAILSPLSKALKKERDRNTLRLRRSSSRRPSTLNPHLQLKPDWPLRTRVLQLFPALRGPVERPASYNRPAAFEALLKEHPHHHKNACPADVEILTDACYPGELTTVLTLIEEQRSANRTPVLLFTRKAIYLGVRRAPKR